jgi:hypothetical protein
MLKQDQNQRSKCLTCATDQMLRKTVLPIIAIALCGLLLPCAGYLTHPSGFLGF